MDAIFGHRNFRSEIIWRRMNSTGRGSRRLANNADCILCYVKTDLFTWNQQYTPHDPEYIRRHYRFKDDGGRLYRRDNLKGAGVRTGSSGKPWRGVNPTDTGSHWAVPNRALPESAKNMSSQEKLDLLEVMGRIYWPPKGSVPAYRRYLDEMPGMAVDTIWTDISGLQSQSKERTGYPTQKPLALYERIIRASSNEGDIVLDPFAGCATTLVAAESLDRQWVGMDIWEGAHKVVTDRLRDTAGLFGDVTYTDKLPDRTDDGETASPFLA